MVELLDALEVPEKLLFFDVRQWFKSQVMMLDESKVLKCIAVLDKYAAERLKQKGLKAVRQ